jgi:uncharacterized protein (DUF58 family)
VTPQPPGEPQAAPRRVPWIYRGLHRSYARGLAINQYFRRRIRPAGIGMLLLLFVAAVLGAGSRLAGGPQLFALTFSLLLVALGWAWLRRATLVATRELPRYATVGEPLTYHVVVRNLSRWAVKDAWLAEMRPDPRPSAERFYFSREPGEERRNVFDRTFAAYRWQWLLELNRAFDGGKALNPLRLARGAGTRVAITLRPLRRGLVPLGDLRVLLADPFGLLQRCRRVAAATETLTVLPRRYRLRPLALAGSARFQTGGEVSSNTIGQAGEFLGLREYRAGDAMRQIHWRSWARLGRPIVKELEETFFPRYGLVLDTFPVAGDAALFEEAVSLAASFAATLETRESLLDLMFIRDEAHVFTAGRGTAKAEKILEVLAAVDIDPCEDFDALGRLVMRHRDELSACLVVLAGWSETRAEMVRMLARSGLSLMVFVICHDRDATARLVAAGCPPVAPHLLRVSHMQADLLGLPDVPHGP